MSYCTLLPAREGRKFDKGVRPPSDFYRITRILKPLSCCFEALLFFRLSLRSAVPVLRPTDVSAQHLSEVLKFKRNNGKRSSTMMIRLPGLLFLSAKA